MAIHQLERLPVLVLGLGRPRGVGRWPQRTCVTSPGPAVAGVTSSALDLGSQGQVGHTLFNVASKACRFTSTASSNPRTDSGLALVIAPRVGCFAWLVSPLGGPCPTAGPQAQFNNGRNRWSPRLRCNCLLTCLCARGCAPSCPAAPQLARKRSRALAPYLVTAPKHGIIGSSKYAERLRKQVVECARDRSRWVWIGDRVKVGRRGRLEAGRGLRARQQRGVVAQGTGARPHARQRMPLLRPCSSLPCFAASTKPPPFNPSPRPAACADASAIPAASGATQRHCPGATPCPIPCS